MTPDSHHRLLRQVLADEKLEKLRRQSLQTLLVAGSHQRRRRMLLRASVGGLLSVLLFTVILFKLPPRPLVLGPITSSPAPAMVSRTTSTSGKIQIITDTELFALFPGRSLALVGPPGRQQLVFLDQPAAASSPR